MADITMCQQADCPHKRYCYRFMARPNEFRQSYFSVDPRSPDGSCPEFVEYQKKEQP